LSFSYFYKILNKITSKLSHAFMIVIIK